jgi:TolB-like protein/Tfp pilus assembly protein PilF
MGEVYRATDTNLARPVAIKVLPDAFAGDARRLARFEREAKTLASLNHPNIASVHGLEAGDGIRALVMELVDGPTLADRIAQGAIPVEEALPIARQIAEALDAAHEQGIIHRDLKPANIKVRPDGIVKVLDFGLAKAMDVPEPAPSDQSRLPTVTMPELTQMGTVLGTAAYMSPEQARGRPVDKRADIWAFGCVLFEMLTGRRLFGRDTHSDTIAALLNDTPDWDRLPERTPDSVRRLLRRTLEKDQNHRLRDIREARVEIGDALRATADAAPYTDPKASRWSRWAVAAAVVLLLIATAAVGYRWRGSSSGATPDLRIRSLAVLPFASVEASPELEQQSDGIAARIIDRLSQLPDLKVTSHQAAFTYRAKDIDVTQVGRELGVQAVLTGSVSITGDVVTVSLELVDARDNSHVWGDRYTKKQSELVSLDTEIPLAIAARLGSPGGGTQPRFAQQQTTNAEAYRLYLQGRASFERWSREGSQAAIGYFERAIAIDPEYALAYAGIADTYMIGDAGESPEVANKKARAAALTALALDPTLSEPHMSFAQLLLTEDWDFVAAEREFKRAIELSPSNVHARHMYSHFLLMVGRVEESRVETETMIGLDPLSSWAASHLGYHQLYARQYDEAIATFRSYLLKMPGDYGVHAQLGDAYYQKGLIREAVEEYLQVPAGPGGKPEDMAALRRAYEAGGMPGYLRKWVEQLKRGPAAFNTATAIAGAYARLGERDLAFEALERAYAERSRALLILRERVEFDNLRSDPRFNDLLRRIGLPPV